MLPTSNSRIQASPQTFKYIGITIVVVFALIFIFGCPKNVSEYREIPTRDFLAKNPNKHDQVEDKTSAASECAVYRRVNSKAIEHDEYIKRRCSKHGLAHSFEDIARKFGARKWYGDDTTLWEYPHDDPIYEKYLPPYRFKEIKFLEIGFGCEGENVDYSGYKLAGFSAKTWLEYFPYAQITEAEYLGQCITDWNKYIRPTLAPGQSERLKIMQCDQEIVSDLERVWGSGGFDIVIEDGGHSMKQQQTTFHTLWPKMKPGSLYFFEDLHTSYITRNYGGGDMKRPANRVSAGASNSWENYNSVEFIMQLFDDMHSGFYKKKRKEVFYEAHDIAAFECIRGLCVFRKGDRS